MQTVVPPFGNSKGLLIERDKHMKKILVALALVASASTASATIANGPHDLNASGGSLPACQYCHAPHLWAQPNMVGGPLWNRNSPAAANFTVYSSTTLDGTVVLGINSLTCLSCHDGATLMSGAVVNGIDPTPLAAMGATYALIGTNLRDDHPVGVAYNGALADYVDAPAFPLYSVRVECGSCHDPHGSWNDARSGNAFLRASADLCAECHLK